jgi:hypothetical protein
MTTVSQSPDLEALLQRLPLFDGFPYLITRVGGALRHITLLPADRSESELRHLARLQVLANRQETCLVLGAGRAIFYGIDATASGFDEAPRGGVFVAGKLRPAEDFLPTLELLARTVHLGAFIDSLEQTGYSTGDSRSEYRPATAEEISRLSGRDADGVPPGLVRCGDCGEYRGECLGPAPHLAQSVTRVYCRCENHNHCARCGDRLADWRLDAHHFNRGDRRVWFTPAFCGMSHACPESLGRIQ